MVYPQNGGALEITAQIVAGHPWQENDTLLLPSKWQSWGSSSSWSMDKIWSSRSVALCQFRMFLGKGTTMTVSLIESFHWNKMLCKLPCYLCCLSPSDLVPTRGGWPQHQESSRNEACYLGHGNRETHEKVFKKQIPDQTKMICLII